MPTLISGGALRALPIASRSGAAALDFEGGALPGGVQRRAPGKRQSGQHRGQFVLWQRTPRRDHAQCIIGGNAGLDRHQPASNLVADAGKQGREVFAVAVSTG
jgi:hypothetical protein